MRVKIRDVLLTTDGMIPGEIYAEEVGLEIRFEADFIQAFGADDRDFFGGGIYGNGHAKVHETRSVINRKGVGVNDSHVAIGHVPPRDTTGDLSLRAGDEVSPI